VDRLSDLVSLGLRIDGEAQEVFQAVDAKALRGLAKRRLDFNTAKFF
jgi:NTP pyrophosphatase (non-canonical NTP hydrolase)